MATKRLAFDKFRVSLNGGTFDIPVSFDGDDDNEAAAVIVDTIPDFDPITVSRRNEGKETVKYIRIPVKGGYIVVKIITVKRRKAFEAEVRKINARANVTDAHLRYFHFYINTWVNIYIVC